MGTFPAWGFWNSFFYKYPQNYAFSYVAKLLKELNLYHCDFSKKFNKLMCADVPDVTFKDRFIAHYFS